MEIRQLRETEMEEALQLVWEVFCAFEAPVYSAQGVEEFRSFLQNREEMARQQFFGAWEGGRLIGVLATSGPHISLFLCAGSGTGAAWEGRCCTRWHPPQTIRR